MHKKNQPKPKFSNCSYMCVYNCAHLSFNTAQISSDNLPKHHSSDTVYWKGGANTLGKTMFQHRCLGLRKDIQPVRKPIPTITSGSFLTIQPNPK